LLFSPQRFQAASAELPAVSIKYITQPTYREDGGGSCFRCTSSPLVSSRSLASARKISQTPKLTRSLTIVFSRSRMGEGTGRGRSFPSHRSGSLLIAAVGVGCAGCQLARFRCRCLSPKVRDRLHDAWADPDPIPHRRERKTHQPWPGFCRSVPGVPVASRRPPQQASCQKRLDFESAADTAIRGAIPTDLGRNDIKWTAKVEPSHQVVAEPMVPGPPDTAGSNAVPPRNLMGLIQELVDQIRPDSDLDDIVHRFNRSPLGGMLGIDLGLDPRHALHDVIIHHSSLHLVHAMAPRRDKSIFTHP
jgi:hypothetical protein